MDKGKYLEHIKDNYLTMGNDIVNQLKYICDQPTTQGSNREEIWKSMFERIIPQKFNIERGVFIVDSKGNISNEVDLAIYDEQYTPYIFKYGMIKFVPVEAVAAVVECKSKSQKKEDLKPWCEKIKELETGEHVVVRMASQIVTETSSRTQESTNPLKILCYITGTDKSEERNREEVKQKFWECEFDIVISADEKNDIRIDFNKVYEDLLDWHIRCNMYKKFDYAGEYKKKYKSSLLPLDAKPGEENKSAIKDLSEQKLDNYKVKGNELMSFVFQFNQILMLINNPIFFPHMDYVKMFSGECVCDKDSKKEE